MTENTNASIFIHIPKTGGTTINTAINKTYWTQQPDFYYRHIVEKTKCSNAGDIFSKENFHKYNQYVLFTMLRHPVDKVISEYYYFKEREVLMNFFKKKPISLQGYIQNYQSQNQTISFLKGRRLYDTIRITEGDLQDIICAIEEIPVHIGIFEKFSDSLNYFSAVAGLKFNQKMQAKRITFKRPSLQEIDSETREMILHHNKYDLALYEFGAKKFNEAIKTLKINTRHEFIKDKYNHIIPYVAKTCLFEFCLDNKKYIKQNFIFFRDLTFFLLKEQKIVDGKTFVIKWNTAFLNAVEHHFSDTDFHQAISVSYDKDGDPLTQTDNIACSIDGFFKMNSHTAHRFYAGMEFKAKFVEEIKSAQKSFFARLLRKK